MTSSPTRVRITSPLDLAATVPTLVGYQPQSGQIVGVFREAGRVVLTAATRPGDPDPAATLTTVARHLSDSTPGVTGATFVAYGAPASWPVAPGSWDTDRLTVDGNRVRCAVPGCSCGTDAALPDAPTPAATALAAATGTTVAPDRDALAAALAGPADWPTEDDTTADDQAAMNLAYALLTDPDARDLLWSRVATDPDAAVRELLEHAARTPTTPGTAPLLAATALAAYVTGQGVAANVLLDRATSTDPHHPAVRLAADIMDAALRPGDVLTVLSAATSGMVPA